jgi:hypothetical protein
MNVKKSCLICEHILLLIPAWFKGYGGKPEHPMYKTTSNTIGQKNPSVHTMPTQFYCRSQKFTEVS